MEVEMDDSWQIPITKVFYEEEEDAKMPLPMSPLGLELGPCVHYMDMMNLTAYPAPRPVASIQQAFRLSPNILTTMEKITCSEPSTFQRTIWPAIMKGHDVIGIAPSSTDRSFAFLPPVFVHMDDQNARKHDDGPAVLIITATTQSAPELERQLEKMTQYTWKNW